MAETASAQDPERFYARAEYLLWWTKDSPAPVPLVTDGPLSGFFLSIATANPSF